MTGRENVFLNGSILGLSRRQIEQHFDEIVGFAELEKFIDLPVKKYSSGMYVRLGFSVATMVPPDILLVDEILSVGDLAFQRKSMVRMRELKKSDTTVLFVSHNMDAVRHFCRRGVFLLEGRVVFDGDIDEAIEYYYRHADKSPVASWASRDAQFAPPAQRAEFVSASVLDSQGQEMECLMPGQPFRLRVAYRSMEPLPAVQIAIAVFDADGTLLSGFNTKGDGVQLAPLNGPAVLDVSFPHGLPLARGACRFSVSILDGDCLETYAVKENAAQLPVRSPQHEAGWLRVPRDWQVAHGPN
jgi:lipopolysaccharide transport system ATP-binding protein